MADYDFYVNTYLGNTLTEKQFSKLAAQAASVLETYERSCKVQCPGPDSRNMAICVMAERLMEHEKRSKGIHATNAISCDQKETLAQQLYRSARIYLDIYRGVS